MRLDEVTSPELAARAGELVLAVPVGSTEQHGPHLPLTTDTDIAVALTERLAVARAHVVVAPAVAYGSSGEHAGFAGTLSIGQAALEVLLVELVRSADAFAAVVLVSCHGGNADPVARAVATSRGEGRRVVAWTPWASAGAGDAHAGRTETSLMLAVRPRSVRVDAAEPGNQRPLRELIGALRTGGVRAVSPNGVLGDPTGANVREGDELLDALLADLVATVDALP